MSSKQTSPFAVVASLAVCAALWLGGCASSETGDTRAADTAAATPVAVGGAELWAATCARCHNLRSPSSYSSAQWEVIVHHMRVRCYLTGEDERAIVAFLKAGAGSDEGKQ